MIMAGEEQNDVPPSAAAAAVGDVAVNGSHGNGGVALVVENGHNRSRSVEGDENYEGVGAEEEEEKEDGDGESDESQPLPALDDGFYEIEAIRRKRMRKGQLQYLIKWRGWPETANTWEPLENLESIPDVVEAFEESLRSGKHRKRKRKHAVHHTLPKKRLERSTTPYTLRHLPPVADNEIRSAPLYDPKNPKRMIHSKTLVFVNEVQNNGDASGRGRAPHANENGSANTSRQIPERNEENDYDPKLRELRARATNRLEADRIAMHLLATQTPRGNGRPELDTVLERLHRKIDRGAQRTESDPAMRFNRELCVSEPVDTPRPISMAVGTVGPACTGMANDAGNNGQENMDRTRPACEIVKIVRPIGYCSDLPPSNGREVVLTFMAMRSDGTQVLVDNKYLKACNPLLLIDYYEQHLVYSPA